MYINQFCNDTMTYSRFEYEHCISELVTYSVVIMKTAFPMNELVMPLLSTALSPTLQCLTAVAIFFSMQL